MGKEKRWEEKGKIREARREGMGRDRMKREGKRREKRDGKGRGKRVRSLKREEGVSWSHMR